MHLYLNGKILPEKEAHLSVHDHGFLYGAGGFETFRTFGGRVFRLEHHLARLRGCCERLRIHPPPESLLNTGKLPEAIEKLLHRNNLEDSVFRLTLSGGPVSGGLPREAYRHPTELLVPRPLPRTGSDPVGLHLLRTRRNTPEFDPRPKSPAYLNSLAGHLEMVDRGIPPGDEGLMLSERRTLAEGVTTNLFLAKDGRLITPAPAEGILPGITRGFVFETAERLEIPVRESTCRIDDLEHAEAVFLTNAVRGLVPVRSLFDINGSLIRDVDTPANPVFQALRTAYETATKIY